MSLFGFEVSHPHISLGNSDEVRRRLIYVGVIALAGALVLSIVAARTDSDSSPSTASVSTALASSNRAATETSVNTPPYSDGTHGRPLVMANGKPVFPISDEDVLSYDINSPFMAVQAKVISVVDDQGFWVGQDGAQRVFVHIVPGTGGKLPAGTASPSSFKAGDLVDVTGYFQLAPVNPGAFGLTGNDVTQLLDQTEYVQANSINAA